MDKEKIYCPYCNKENDYITYNIQLNLKVGKKDIIEKTKEYICSTCKNNIRLLKAYN